METLEIQERRADPTSLHLPRRRVWSSAERKTRRLYRTLILPVPTPVGPEITLSRHPAPARFPETLAALLVLTTVLVLATRALPIKQVQISELTKSAERDLVASAGSGGDGSAPCSNLPSILPALDAIAEQWMPSMANRSLAFEMTNEANLLKRSCRNGLMSQAQSHLKSLLSILRTGASHDI